LTEVALVYYKGTTTLSVLNAANRESFRTLISFFRQVFTSEYRIARFWKAWSEPTST